MVCCCSILYKKEPKEWEESDNMPTLTEFILYLPLAVKGMINNIIIIPLLLATGLFKRGDKNKHD